MSLEVAEQAVRDGDLDAASSHLQDAVRKDPAKAVLIKADSNLHYGEVRAVMDELAENGKSTLLLAAEKKKGGE